VGVRTIGETEEKTEGGKSHITGISLSLKIAIWYIELLKDGFDIFKMRKGTGNPVSQKTQGLPLKWKEHGHAGHHSPNL